MVAKNKKEVLKFVKVIHKQYVKNIETVLRGSGYVYDANTFPLSAKNIALDAPYIDTSLLQKVTKK